MTSPLRTHCSFSLGQSLYVVPEHGIVWHGVSQADVRSHVGKSYPDFFFPLINTARAR